MTNCHLIEGKKSCLAQNSGTLIKCGIELFDIFQFLVLQYDYNIRKYCCCCLNYFSPTSFSEFVVL